ncbi:glycosyltransferase [Cysteiniphilum sp. QT6929]|uniref:glycosyltransferase n=1 Tax=Cysteiniphilum sp. QT6929 TaxID=2975055 RepID=UPI0024B38966|nr:glycosyltransferase [Cysteiniphilum sp. QT6929]WHN64928.1 glycosyltransferase [Cysteiniphilum sp. QT6929]
MLKANDKVLLISQELKRGGADVVLLNLARLLLEQGLQVYLIVFGKVDIDIDERIILFAEAARNARGIKVLQEILVSRLITKLDKLHDFKMIFSNKTTSRKWLKASVENKTFYYRHFCSSFVLDRKLKESEKSYQKMRKKEFRHFNKRRIICVSHGVKETLLNRFEVKPKSIHVLYNFFDFDLIRSKAQAFQIDEKPYILHVGRYSLDSKRQDLLLAAFEQVTAYVNLIFITDNVLALEKQVGNAKKQSQIKVMNFMSNPFPYMKNAQVVVLCSDYEAFGNVIVEAMICGTPVVSTDCRSGPKEILVENMAKYLVPCNDPLALAKSMEEALAFPVIATQQQLEKFSFESAFNTINKIYQKDLL